MALNTRMVALATTLAGSGIAIPVYLTQVRNNTVNVATSYATTTPLVVDQFSSSPDIVSKSKAPVVKPEKKIECEFYDVSSDYESFLVSKKKNSKLYSTVSCKNTVTSASSDSILDKYWEGLFPQDALNDIFSPKKGTKFSISFEITREEGVEGTQDIFSFSDTKSNSTINCKLDNISETSSKKEVTLSIKGNKYNSKEIYIFLALNS